MFKLGCEGGVQVEGIDIALEKIPVNPDRITAAATTELVITIFHVGAY